MKTTHSRQSETQTQRHPYRLWLMVTAALLAASWHASGQASTVVHKQSTPVVIATVLSAQPITEIVRQPITKEVCYEPQQARNSKTPAIVGGILGGLVGNQFGSGSGRTATTIAGAALGASIGADRSRREQQRYRTPRHCEVRTEYEESRQIVGYRVSYELDGRTFVTQTEHNPGKTIAIEVVAN